MVKDQATDAHQLSGTTSSYIGCELFCKGQEKHSHTPENEQYNCKLGGTVPPELNHLMKDLWTWVLEREITLHATHLVETLTVTVDEESCMMKDRTDWMLWPPNLQENQSPPWATTSGPFCIQTNPPTPSVCQLETRSICYDNGCLQPQLGGVQGLCKLTLESNNQSTHPNQDSTGKTGPSGSSMESTTLVPNLAGNANTQTNPTTQQYLVIHILREERRQGKGIEAHEQAGGSKYH